MKIVRKERIGKFDAEKLFDRLRQLDDFREFSRHVMAWMEKA